jgi:hypothetical protein
MWKGYPQQTKRGDVGKIAEAASTGSRRTTLEAMREKLAVDMDEAPPAVVAQIAGRLSAVLAEIESLPEEGEVSKFDEIANRRTARLAVSEHGKPATTKANRSVKGGR